MVRFQWHIENGISASIGRKKIRFQKSAKVQHAFCEIELLGQTAPIEACFTLPPNYLSDDAVCPIGVILAHGVDTQSWKGQVLTEAAVALAEAGFLVVRSICTEPGELKRRRVLEISLAAAAASPYARHVQQWVIAGMGLGARAAASAAARLDRQRIAGVLLLSYPLQDFLPEDPAGATVVTSAAGAPLLEPLLSVPLPVLLVQGGLDPACPLEKLRTLCAEAVSPDVRLVVVPDVDGSFGESSNRGPSAVKARFVGTFALTFVAALLCGQLDQCHDLPHVHPSDGANQPNDNAAHSGRHRASMDIDGDTGRGGVGHSSVTSLSLSAMLRDALKNSTSGNNEVDDGEDNDADTQASKDGDEDGDGDAAGADGPRLAAMSVRALRAAIFARHAAAARQKEVSRDLSRSSAVAAVSAALALVASDAAPTKDFETDAAVLKKKHRLPASMAGGRESVFGQAHDPACAFLSAQDRDQRTGVPRKFEDRGSDDVEDEDEEGGEEEEEEEVDKIPFLAPREIRGHKNGGRKKTGPSFGAGAAEPESERIGIEMESPLRRSHQKEAVPCAVSSRRPFPADSMDEELERTRGGNKGSHSSGSGGKKRRTSVDFLAKQLLEGVSAAGHVTSRASPSSPRTGTGGDSEEFGQGIASDGMAGGDAFASAAKVRRQMASQEVDGDKQMVYETNALASGLLSANAFELVSQRRQYDMSAVAAATSALGRQGVDPLVLDLGFRRESAAASGGALSRGAEGHAFVGLSRADDPSDASLIPNRDSDPALRASSASHPRVGSGVAAVGLLDERGDGAPEKEGKGEDAEEERDSKVPGCLAGAVLFGQQRGTRATGDGVTVNDNSAKSSRSNSEVEDGDNNNDNENADDDEEEDNDEDEDEDRDEEDEDVLPDRLVEPTMGPTPGRGGCGSGAGASDVLSDAPKGRRGLARDASPEGSSVRIDRANLSLLHTRATEDVLGETSAANRECRAGDTSTHISGASGGGQAGGSSERECHVAQRLNAASLQMLGSGGGGGGGPQAVVQVPANIDQALRTLVAERLSHYVYVYSAASRAMSSGGGVNGSGGEAAAVAALQAQEILSLLPMLPSQVVQALAAVSGAGPTAMAQILAQYLNGVAAVAAGGPDFPEADHKHLP